MNPSEMKSVRSVVEEAQERLILAGKEEHIIDAQWLMMAVYDWTRPSYIMNQTIAVEQEKLAVFNAYMTRRLSGEPLQYILNHQSFYGYDFYVDERVLIPRFETEELVEKAVNICRKMSGQGMLKVMDMCSGSGCIGITVLKEVEQASCTFVDISKDALEVAEKNSRQLGVAGRSTFIHSDLFADVKEDEYDMILSNPPYIVSEVIDSLEEEVRMKEPGLALDGGQDGLDFYRRIVRDSRDKLTKGGWLFFEIGYDQMEAVKELMLSAGYSDVAGYRDLSGNDRIVAGCWNDK